MGFHVDDGELKEALLEFHNALRKAPAGTFDDPKWSTLHTLLGYIVARLTDRTTPC